MNIARERIAKQSAQARMGRRFAGACAEQLIEVQKVGVAAKRSGVERERLVCFSFASVFFCTSKENAQTNIGF